MPRTSILYHLDRRTRMYLPYFILFSPYWKDSRISKREWAVIEGLGSNLDIHRPLASWRPEAYNEPLKRERVKRNGLRMMPHSAARGCFQQVITLRYSFYGLDQLLCWWFSPGGIFLRYRRRPFARWCILFFFFTRFSTTMAACQLGERTINKTREKHSRWKKYADEQHSYLTSYKFMDMLKNPAVMAHPKLKFDHVGLLAGVKWFHVAHDGNHGTYRNVP